MAVTFGAWVGIVRQIESDIYLKFPDGSEAKIADRYADTLEDVNDKDRDVVRPLTLFGTIVTDIHGHQAYLASGDEIGVHFQPTHISKRTNLKIPRTFAT